MFDVAPVLADEIIRQAIVQGLVCLLVAVAVFVSFSILFSESSLDDIGALFTIPIGVLITLLTAVGFDLLIRAIIAPNLLVIETVKSILHQ